MSDIIVRTDKNLFLLFTFLDLIGQNDGSSDHPLRGKTREHFKDYPAPEIKEEDYVHSSKPVEYLLRLSEAPEFKETYLPETEKEKWTAEKGKVLVPHLRKFYEQTDFPGFYEEILPEYEGVCVPFREALGKVDLNTILNRVWGTKVDFKMVVIPMPLSAGGSYGPLIGQTAYQVIAVDSVVKVDGILSILAHEGSHPRAKVLLAPLAEEINKHEYLYQELIKDNPSWPEAYNMWGIAFEEHFIRAVQDVVINPLLGIGSMEKDLTKEETRGFRYVRIIAEEVQRYQEEREGSLGDAVLNCLSRLENGPSIADTHEF